MRKLSRADQENQTAIAATKLARNIRYMASRFPDDPSMQNLIQLCRYVDDLSDSVIKYRNDIVKLKHKLSNEIRSKLTT